MAEKKFTFVELHLDGDTQFGPKTLSDALPIGDVEDEAEEADTEDERGAEEGDSNGKGAFGVVVALLLLVGIAIALKKFRASDDAEELEAHEEPDVVVG